MYDTCLSHLYSIREALAEEKIGIRMLLPEEIEQLKKEGRLKPLYEV